MLEKQICTEAKNRDALNDNDTHIKNTLCLVLEKLVALKRVGCDRNSRVITALLVYYALCLIRLSGSVRLAGTVSTLLLGSIHPKSASMSHNIVIY